MLFLSAKQKSLREAIEKARHKAHTFTDKVIDEFQDAAENNPESIVVDPENMPLLVLVKPSRAFRRAAHAMQLIGYGDWGEFRLADRYPLDEFQIPVDHPACFNPEAQLKISRAVKEIFARYFPEEGWVVLEEGR